MDIKKIVEYYIDTYHPEIKTKIDLRKNEENKVKSLIEKLLDKNTVYKELAFEALTEKEQCKLLYHILEKVEEREIISNIGKNDINRDYDMFIMAEAECKELYEKIFKDIPNFQPLNIKKEIRINRQIITDMTNSSSMLIQSLLKTNYDIIREIKDEQEKFLFMGLEYKYYRYIDDYIDYVIDSVVQIVIYRVINNNKFKAKEEFFMALRDKINELGRLIDIQINGYRKEQIKRKSLYAIDLTRYFSLYRTKCSYFNEYIEILRLLRKEFDESKNNLFKPLQDKYKTKKVLLSEDKISEIKDIITEGESLYDYNTKLSETRKMINLFHIYGGRNCYSNCEQDIKVYFREIFMSRQKYKGKGALRIVRAYLKECKESGIMEFKNKAHYMFLREKISRGYFREQGLLEFYYLKTELQESLFNNILKVYLLYDYDEIILFINDFNYHILKKINEIFIK